MFYSKVRVQFLVWKEIPIATAANDDNKHSSPRKFTWPKEILVIFAKRDLPNRYETSKVNMYLKSETNISFSNKIYDAKGDMPQSKAEVSVFSLQHSRSVSWRVRLNWTEISHIQPSQQKLVIWCLWNLSKRCSSPKLMSAFSKPFNISTKPSQQQQPEISLKMP